MVAKKFIKSSNVLPGGGIEVLSPPLGKTWKITSLFAPGQDFSTAFGDKNHHTEPIKDYHCLCCETYIDQGVSIIFRNDSDKDRIGFCCGLEE